MSVSHIRTGRDLFKCVPLKTSAMAAGTCAIRQSQARSKDSRGHRHALAASPCHDCALGRAVVAQLQADRDVTPTLPAVEPSPSAGPENLHTWLERKPRRTKSEPPAETSPPPWIPPQAPPIAGGLEPAPTPETSPPAAEVDYRDLKPENVVQAPVVTPPSQCAWKLETRSEDTSPDSVEICGHAAAAVRVGAKKRTQFFEVQIERGIDAHRGIAP